MPTRVCSVSGCPEFEPCPKHPKLVRPTPDPRGGSARRGYGGKWKAYSEAYRAKHPWCAPCLREGRKTEAFGVDHIVPVTGPSDPGFWLRSNHQSICRSCHAAKTAAEGRTARPGGAAGAGPDLVFA